jgi:hypothetical protein
MIGEGDCKQFTLVILRHGIVNQPFVGVCYQETLIKGEGSLR